MDILIALSGGLDSATLLAALLDDGHRVTAVSFEYGSKHNQYERRSAEAIAKHYKIKLIKKDISAIFEGLKSDLLLTGAEIPEGSYKADNMKSTVVPARNMIFISIMTAMASSMHLQALGIGIHAGDHHIYPDCRPAFIESMERTVRLATGGEILAILNPFLHLDKTAIAHKAMALGLPIKLTRTCYKDQPIACGVCGSCNERLEAFAAIGVVDPIEYEETEK